MEAFQAFQSEILMLVVFTFIIGGICGYLWAAYRFTEADDA